MKIVWRILLVLIIVVPIFMCWKTLQTVWDEPDEPSSYTSGEDVSSVSSGDLEDVKNLIDDEVNKVTASNLGDGVEYDVTGTDPISKVYENAEVSISLANVYENHDETSTVLGKLEKGSLITVQSYDNGWSTVTNYTLSGWMKTENIKLPSTDNNMTLEQPVAEGSKGTVKVSDGLRVRESNNTSAKVLTSLTNGQEVEILETSNGWYKIKANGVTGWVSSDYVTVNK